MMSTTSNTRPNALEILQNLNLEDDFFQVFGNIDEFHSQDQEFATLNICKMRQLLAEKEKEIIMLRKCIGDAEKKDSNTKKKEGATVNTTNATTIEIREVSFQRDSSSNKNKCTNGNHNSVKKKDSNTKKNEGVTVNMTNATAIGVCEVSFQRDSSSKNSNCKNGNHNSVKNKDE